MKTKIKCLIFLLILSGCQTNKIKEPQTVDLPIPPPFPPSILPPSPPPKFIPDPNEIKDIQVNRLPHPFNVNGTMPYAVWVDGKKLPTNGAEANAIVKALNLKFEQPKNTARIHGGEGWLYPINLKEEEKDSPELLISN